MTSKRKFVGFSTHSSSPKNWTLTDRELVKRDFINHLYTQKGERVMMPEFGTTIYEKVFEPFTEGLKDDIVKEIQDVVNFDPRLELRGINVTNLRQGLKIEIDLYYRPWDAVESLSLIFDRRSQERK